MFIFVSSSHLTKSRHSMANWTRLAGSLKHFLSMMFLALLCLTPIITILVRQMMVLIRAQWTGSMGWVNITDTVMSSSIKGHHAHLLASPIIDTVHRHTDKQTHPETIKHTDTRSHRYADTPAQRHKNTKTETPCAPASVPHITIFLCRFIVYRSHQRRTWWSARGKL